MTNVNENNTDVLFLYRLSRFSTALRRLPVLTLLQIRFTDLIGASVKPNTNISKYEGMQIAGKTIAKVTRSAECGRICMPKTEVTKPIGRNIMDTMVKIRIF